MTFEPSRTAVGVAALRAAHQLVDQPPRILEDPVAVRLLDEGSAARLLARRDELDHPAARALRAHMVLRSRYAEDCLSEAVERGVTQYVVLGAGMDTFAYRQPRWASGLRIFEVDQPASQRAKRDRLAASGVTVPDNVTFVSVDFDRDGLMDRLAADGVNLSLPTFFSWLGVTMYLEEAAVMSVLRAVATLPAGSEIVFTFVGAPEDGEEDATAPLAAMVAAVGEPWRTRFRPSSVPGMLTALGFSSASLLTREESIRRYLSGRTDSLKAPKRSSIARARVGTESATMSRVAPSGRSGAHDTPRQCVFRINAERVVLLGWSRAILLQMAHPLVAAGVASHSTFRDSPIASARRLHQTVRAMLGLTFGSDAEQARVIAEIRAIHRRVHGVLKEAVGTFQAGTRYSAEDPALLLWVHATLVESSVIVYSAIVRELTIAERDAYCLEASSVAIALGAIPERVPRDWAGLTAYIEAMHASGALAVGADARAVASGVLRGRLTALTGPVAWMNRELTAGWLPLHVREQYGFAWDHGHDRRFQRLVGALRRVRRSLPLAIAWWPEARV